MLAKRFSNAKLGIELTSYIDNKQNIWFQGKDVAKILGYSDTDKAIRRHVDEEDKYKGPAKTAGGLQQSFYINESGFYSLVLSSKLETTKKFKKWVTSQVLPSIRKFGLFFSLRDKRIEKPKNYYQHRFVYEVFKGLIPRCLEIDHINNCKTDNRIKNLQLLNHKQNVGKSRNKAIVSINVENGKKKVFISIKKASIELGICASNISNICNKKKYYKSANCKKDCKKYTFEYLL